MTFRPTDRSVSDSNEQRRRCPSERWDLADRRTIITFHLSSPLALSFPLVLCSFAFALVCRSVGQQVDREGERERQTEEFAPAGSVGYAFAPLSAPLRSSPPSFPSSLHRTALLGGRGVHSLCPGDDNMLNSGSGRPAGRPAAKARRRTGQAQARLAREVEVDGPENIIDRPPRIPVEDSCLHGSMVSISISKSKLAEDGRRFACTAPQSDQIPLVFRCGRLH